jgi:hypothetical protein
MIKYSLSKTVSSSLLSQNPGSGPRLHAFSNWCNGKSLSGFQMASIGLGLMANVPAKRYVIKVIIEYILHDENKLMNNREKMQGVYILFKTAEARVVQLKLLVLKFKLLIKVFD